MFLTSDTLIPALSSSTKVWVRTTFIVFFLRYQFPTTAIFMFEFQLLGVPSPFLLWVFVLICPTIAIFERLKITDSGFGPCLITFSFRQVDVQAHPIFILVFYRTVIWYLSYCLQEFSPTFKQFKHFQGSITPLWQT